MAKLIGGILGRVTGKVGGLVFSQARTRTGKENTVRTKVTPSNPQTAAQTKIRTLFKRALSIIRKIGYSIYHNDWDRAVSQLPGFQSLQSTLLSAKTVAGLFDTPVPVPLGTLAPLAAWDPEYEADDDAFSIAWDTTVGVDGSDDDTVYFFAYPAAPVDGLICQMSLGEKKRSEGMPGVSIEVGDTPGDWIIGCYVKGAGDFAGQLSVCDFQKATIPA